MTKQYVFHFSHACVKNFCRAFCFVMKSRTLVLSLPLLGSIEKNWSTSEGTKCSQFALEVC